MAWAPSRSPEHQGHEGNVEAARHDEEPAGVAHHSVLFRRTHHKARGVAEETIKEGSHSCIKRADLCSYGVDGPGKAGRIVGDEAQGLPSIRARQGSPTPNSRRSSSTSLVREGVDDLAHVVNAQPVFGNEMAQGAGRRRSSPSRAPGNS